jgi:DNA-binding NarL/FixJ family response regulator
MEKNDELAMKLLETIQDLSACFKILTQNSHNCIKEPSPAPLTPAPPSQVPAQPLEIQGLSKRNKNILGLLAKNISVKEIATELELKEATVGKDIQYLSSVNMVDESGKITEIGKKYIASALAPS